MFNGPLSGFIVTPRLSRVTKFCSCGSSLCKQLFMFKNIFFQDEGYAEYKWGRL